MRRVTLLEALALVPDPRDRKGRIHPLVSVLRVCLERRGALTGDHVALDGKTLVGSKDAGLPGRHLLAAYATAQAAVLGQLEVARTTNEHKAALGLLGVLPLSGRVVTADANRFAVTHAIHRHLADRLPLTVNPGFHSHGSVGGA